jgi:hypothetical protein
MNYEIEQLKQKISYYRKLGHIVKALALQKKLDSLKISK